MSTSFSKIVKNTIKYWYIPLIVGLLFIGIGTYVLLQPLASYVALSVLFSLSFLFSGLAEIIFSIQNRKNVDNWGWSLTFGILTLLLGVLLVANPEISIVTLPFYVGFTMLFRSLMGISYAMDLKRFGVLDWGNLLAIGILGTLFSFLLIWNPFFSGITIVFWTGLSLITSGIFSSMLSFKLRKIGK